MSRIGVSVNVINPVLGSYSFTTARTVNDPFTSAQAAAADGIVLAAEQATAVADATVLQTNATTAKTDALALQTLLGNASADMATANTAAVLVHTDDGLMATTATNGLVALMNITGGGTVAYTAATEQYSGSPAASAPTWTTGLQTAFIALFNAAGAALVTAVANLATANADTYALGPTPAAVALLATALADFKLIATTATNGLVAVLSNQTFNAGTCQLSGAPSGSVTPSQAVMLALITIMNTYGTAIVAANAAILAIKTNTAALATAMTLVVSDTTTAVTAAGTVVSDLATVSGEITTTRNDIANATAAQSDLVLSIDLVKAPTASVIEIAMQQLLTSLQGSNYVAP